MSDDHEQQTEAQLSARLLGKGTSRKMQEGRFEMPRGEWTDKQERKYEKITKSQKEQGKSTRRAKSIGAATVNKERARKGGSRQASRTSTRDKPSSRRGGQRSGTSAPKGRTRDQLYAEAKRRGIEGRSKMNKAQLQRAVAAKGR